MDSHRSTLAQGGARPAISLPMILLMRVPIRQMRPRHGSSKSASDSSRWNVNEAREIDELTAVIEHSGHDRQTSGTF
jgi:hypothetical protein